MTYHAYYIPEGWAFLKVQVDGCDARIKVFGAWSGSYSVRDTWKINSGCIDIQERENDYLVTGYSGSQYLLNKESNYISSYNQAVLDDMIAELKSYGHQVEIISVQDAIAAIGA